MLMCRGMVEETLEVWGKRYAEEDISEAIQEVTSIEENIPC